MLCQPEVFDWDEWEDVLARVPESLMDGPALAAKWCEDDASQLP